mgnify:CR=1 FL=1
MSEFKRYFRQGYCEARPYILGEALTGISVNKEDAEEVATTGGGMILLFPAPAGMNRARLYFSSGPCRLIGFFIAVWPAGRLQVAPSAARRRCHSRASRSRGCRTAWPKAAATAMERRAKPTCRLRSR